METSGSAETYLAHQLPDKAKAFATIVGLLALLLVFDWRLGLLSLIPVVLGFATMTRMTGKGMQQKMTEYQNALSDMSGEAVEYPEGCRADKFVVLSEGCVAEEGTSDELYCKDGIYSHMVMLQTESQNWVLGYS
ncbi:hypothetical protein D7V86_13180 [bacterium D16-51]|nr:hypothetical protein D7V96_17290 [bacterium D16-59]RKI59301.1 hypothetical protein D7V86_13180 [bacterium D16-51]